MSISLLGRSGKKRAGWRLLATLSALLLALVGVPGVASAGAPSGSTSSGADILCESDTGFMSISVHEDEAFGEAFLDVFFEPFEEPFVLFGFTEEFSFDGTALSAQVEMFEEHFGENGEENGDGEPEPAGVAFIDATFDPIGEAETFMDRFREGNRWVEIRETHQEAATSGSATIEGIFDFDLSECGGSLSETEFWATNPNAFNNRFEGHFLECGLEGPDGFGHVFADSFEEGTFLDVFIVGEEGPGLFGFTEDAVFTESELSGVVDLFDEETGEGPVAQAVVEASLESAGVSSSEIIFQNGRVKQTEEFFDVAGTVAINGSEFEMVECFSVAFEVREHFSNPNGPKPTGMTPGNDTPEGADTLESRATTNAQTKAAAPAPEVACTEMFDGDNGEENGENGHEPEEFPLPIGNTLWYSFEGTGAEVTIDSGGSNFDTILGIYDADLNQIVCVDDVGGETGFSLQAAATIDTVDGDTYLVQVGGFGFFNDPEFPSLAEFGRVRLNMS